VQAELKFHPEKVAANFSKGVTEMLQNNYFLLSLLFEQLIMQFHSRLLCNNNDHV
jgi:hypothetical protein